MIFDNHILRLQLYIKLNGAKIMPSQVTNLTDVQLIFMILSSSVFKKRAIYSAIALALLISSCLSKDDDVVYKFFKRKPTPKEGFARIRFVLIKVFASINIGVMLSIFLIPIIENYIEYNLSENYSVIFMVVMIAVTSLLIGYIQNLIRILQGRPIRPIFDVAVLKYNINARLRRNYEK